MRRCRFCAPNLAIASGRNPSSEMMTTWSVTRVRDVGETSAVEPPKADAMADRTTDDAAALSASMRISYGLRTLAGPGARLDTRAAGCRELHFAVTGVPWQAPCQISPRNGGITHETAELAVRRDCAPVAGRFGGLGPG